MSIFRAESAGNAGPEVFEESTLEAVPPLQKSFSDPALSPEIYRQIYVALDLPGDRGPVIGITSAVAGEGRTTIALGMAHTLATDLNVPVSLVEVDVERPSLALHFGIPPSPGLRDVLRGKYRLEDVARPVVTRNNGQNLSVLPAGVSEADNGSFLSQLADRDPFQGSRELGVVTILDLPPILNHGYSSLAAGVADALLLVIRAGIVPANAVREAINRLKDRPLQGAVFNGERSALPSWWPERRRL